MAFKRINNSLSAAVFAARIEILHCNIDDKDPKVSLHEWRAHKIDDLMRIEPSLQVTLGEESANDQVVAQVRRTLSQLRSTRRNLLKQTNG